MRIACFNVRMKIVLDVKVGCTVGVGADQDPVEARDKQCHTCNNINKSGRDVKTHGTRNVTINLIKSATCGMCEQFCLYLTILPAFIGWFPLICN